MEFIRNGQLNAMAIMVGVCGAIIFFTYLLKIQSKKIKISLLIIEVISLIVLIADRYAYSFRGETSEIGFWMVRICNFSVFFCLYLAEAFSGLYIKYIFEYNNPAVKTTKRLDVSVCISGIGCLLVIITQFTGFYYSFSADNLYERGFGYPICIILHFVSLLLQSSFVIQYYKYFSKKIRLSLLFFDVLPIISGLLQTFFYGISMNTFSLAIATVGLFIFALIDLNYSLAEAEKREKQLENEFRGNTELLFEQTVAALSGSIDAKDKYTQGHSQRVANYSKQLAKMIGLSRAEQRELYFAALLHDVGKIGVKDEILNKEGKLTDEEFGEIKKHPGIGSDILDRITLLPSLRRGALYHHERYDGKGYPKGLKGDDIPLIARIISVADAYDAMTSKRSYRDIIPQQHVREQMVMGSGTQFDPEIAAKMIELIDKDFEYTMREQFKSGVIAEKSSFKFAEYLSDFSNPTWIVSVPTTFKLKSVTYDVKRDVFSMPSLVIYDSRDGKIHTDERTRKEMHYLEFLTIRADGEVTPGEFRKIRITKTPSDEISSSLFRQACEKGIEIAYTMVRYKDHLKVVLTNPFQTIEYIVALQDSIRYSYGSITGENCDVELTAIEKGEKSVEADEVPRIAPKISYADGPVGDIPNIEVPAWRVVHSEEMKLKGKNTLTFHSLSLPTARLIWHCPFVVFYTSDDHKFHGPGFQEYLLLRLDGECWSESELVKCTSYVNKNMEFGNWANWKETNKAGVDCTVSITREGNKLSIKTDNSGLELVCTAVLPESVEDLYVVLTGDQCAITDIRMS